MMGRPLAVLMRHDETCGVKFAVDYSGKSESTIRRLCREHGLYRQTTPAAPWEISRPGLEMALHGDVVAIELLRAGRRSSPEVRRYLDYLGLPE
ncbi:hypothetical protein ACLNGM_20240 [Aureimonas phyllosphaerae]|uniref:hypothetical protein n=1 Tax=Aureimonas phyllosphaerae TaxID=1166078 RepID=UPI003A5C13F2